MRKRISVIVLVLFVLLLAGCAKASPMQGDWKDENQYIYTFNSQKLALDGQAAVAASVFTETDLAWLSFSIDTGGTLASGGFFAVPEESNRIYFIISTPGGEPVTAKATFVMDGKAGTLVITGEDGAVTSLTK